MKPQIKMAVWVVFATIALSGGLWAQAAQESDPKAHAGKSDLMSRVTIEVSGGEKSTPVENASVYLKYVEEHKLKKNKKVELNVKTNRDGTAHIPETPTGRVLIQVVADGWKTYGRWYDITEAKQTIKVDEFKSARGAQHPDPSLSHFNSSTLLLFYSSLPTNSANRFRLLRNV